MYTAFKPPSLRHGGHFDLDSVATNIKALEAEMSAPDFWVDANRAKSVSRKAAELKNEYEAWRSVRDEVADLIALFEMAEQEKDSTALVEIESSLAAVEAKFKKLEFSMLFRGAHDGANAMLAVHAGSGGDEAQDWAAMLARMYMRYADARGWKVEVMSESRGEAGIKSIMLRIEGRYAYGSLKSEAGTHRLVRISPFDAEKLRHTTFALVEVLPEIDDVADFEIDAKDLRIDTFMSGGKGGQSVNTTYSAVRIVHIPTGITVSCQNERSQTQNREFAMKVLKSKLLKLKEEELEREKKNLRGEFKSAEWGSQIRSYVLHPYKMVKDHRTGYETSEAERVLEGDLDGFIEAYLKSQVTGVSAEMNLDV